jgi:hypothetical protein
MGDLIFWIGVALFVVIGLWVTFLPIRLLVAIIRRLER